MGSSVNLFPIKSLIFLTNRVGRQLASLALEDMEFEGWKPRGTHMAILADLYIKDGQRQQDLAISSIKDKGTIARGLNALEKEEFVVRETNPSDRRNKLIFLTDKALRFEKYFNPILIRVMQEAARDIAPKDLAVCTEVLQRIYQNLQNQLTIPEKQ
ncbi:MAG: MarR family transcriptional regulator [Bacteroidota bacterium]